MNLKVTGRFADNYSENYEYRTHIDKMIEQIGKASDASKIGDWIPALGCRRLKSEDWSRTPPIRLFLYFNVEKRHVVLEGILGPGNWALLR